MSDVGAIALRLAGPIQSWGGANRFNVRQTRGEPTKSGIVGLLAAASGRRRSDPIADLVELRLGVRVDRRGSILRDYHTLSDYTGRPLPTAELTKKGTQRPTGPKKLTGVTERYYLEDAVFLAVLEGQRSFLAGLADAIRRPAFPLALGRRACVPTQPILLGSHEGDVRSSSGRELLESIPWQGRLPDRSGHRERRAEVTLPVSADPELWGEAGDWASLDVVDDVPTSFDPLERGFRSRSVVHEWVTIPTGVDEPDIVEQVPDAHDPFALFLTGGN